MLYRKVLELAVPISCGEILCHLVVYIWYSDVIHIEMDTLG